MTRRNQPVYEEMRSLAPYFLITSGIYMAIMTALFFALGFDYTLLTGGVYGIIIAVLNFLALGKSAQAALKRSAKSAQTYMNIMYCARYLGLFALLTIGALAPFISLIASVIPLFFPRIAITVRAFTRKED
ncbi:MAG: hypothetical protein NC299_06030 [Lachnospiraceae bacterium]|nr:hypothetical protein [Ruminococcus sp.]MCM1274911.1 hypothetical protein [Lachnospiraceae bacterium]